jgi:HrpA-like RNA helicase
MMAEFPLDPQLAKMMVAAPEYRCPARSTPLLGISGVSVSRVLQPHSRPGAIQP